jgi:hypothetical protein
MGTMSPTSSHDGSSRTFRASQGLGGKTGNAAHRSYPRLEGVVVDHGGSLMEYAMFTVVEPGPSEELLCAVGCSDENSTGGATCDGLSRPPFTTTTVTPEQGASCAAEALNNFICIDQL